VRLRGLDAVDDDDDELAMSLLTEWRQASGHCWSLYHQSTFFLGHPGSTLHSTDWTTDCSVVVEETKERIMIGNIFLLWQHQYLMNTLPKPRDFFHLQ